MEREREGGKNKDRREQGVEGGFNEWVLKLSKKNVRIGVKDSRKVRGQ